MIFYLIAIISGLIILIYLFYYKERKIFQTHAAFGFKEDEQKSKSQLFRFVHYCIIILLFSFLSTSTIVNETSSNHSKNKVVFAIDVSQSMNAEDGDTKNSISRLNSSKSFIETFIKSNPQFEYALVEFTSEAKILSPLTFDHNILLTLLQRAGSTEFDTQGSDIFSALKLIEEKYQKTNIILISDGEPINTDENKISGFESKIITIGVGSKNGTRIPVNNSLLGKVQYKTYKGKYVTTQLEDNILKNIASSHGGNYFHLSDSSNNNQIIDTIISGLHFREEKTENKMTDIVLFIILFFIFIDALFFFSIVQSLFRNKIIATIFLCLFLQSCSLSDPTTILTNNSGVSEYQKENYDAASSYFFEARNNETYKDMIYYNLCTSSYQSAEFEKAWEYCHKSVEKNDTNPNTWYNLGNAYYRLGEAYEASDIHRTQINWQQAIEAYENVLHISPDDQEAKENRDFVKNKLQQLGKSQSQNQNSDDENQKNNASSQGNNNNSSNNSANNSSNKNEPLSDKQKQSLESMLEAIENDEREWQEQYRNFGQGYTQELDALQYPEILEEFMSGALVNPFGDTLYFNESETQTPDW